MELFELFQHVVVALYLLGALLVLGGFALDNQGLRRLGSLCTVLGFIAHSVDLILFLTIFKKMAILSGGFYISLLAWCLLLVYFLLWYRFRLTFLGLTAAPLALALFLFSMVTGGLLVPMPPALSGLFFWLHTASLTICTGLVTMGFGAALAFLHMDRRIKRKEKISGPGSDMGSLSTFDTINRWAVLAGFPLYTLGILSGFLWPGPAGEPPRPWGFTQFASLGVLFLYAFLFHQRIMLGWRGRKAAWTLIWVFAFIVLSLLHHFMTFVPAAPPA